MIKKLDDCNVGDFVILWCIGWNNWDTDVVKIIEKGILITIEYRNGNTGRFSCSTECKVASF
jgi:hypothetical protein